MFFIRCWIIAAVVAFCPALAEAGSCRAVVVHRPAVVVEKVAVAVPVVAQFVSAFIPLYGGYYTPPVTAPVQAVPGVQGVQAPCVQGANGNAEIVAYLKAMDQRMQRLEQQAGIPPQVQPPLRGATSPMSKAENGEKPVAGERGVALATSLTVRHCASCHDSGVAAAKGGKLTLTDGGKLGNISPETLGKMIEQVSSGKMPKGTQMQPQERLDLITALVGN